MSGRSVEQASLAVRLGWYPQIMEMSDDDVPDLTPARQQDHDVTGRDHFLGVDSMPAPVRRADPDRRAFDQAAHAQGDEHPLSLQGVGFARAEGVQRDGQVGSGIAVAAGAQWAEPLDRAGVVVLLGAAEQGLGSCVEVSVGEMAVPRREDVVPPLVHRSQQPALGAVVDLKRNQSLPACVYLRTVRRGEIPIGRVEGDPSNQIAPSLLHVLGGSRDGDRVGVARVAAVGLASECGLASEFGDARKLVDVDRPEVPCVL